MHFAIGLGLWTLAAWVAGCFIGALLRRLRGTNH
jgi:hypothetical protein